METTKTFKSQQANKTRKIFYNTHCETEYAIYLIECTKCNLQYIGKDETPFNMRLNNNREGIKNSKEILADKHLKKGVIDLTNTQNSL